MLARNKMNRPDLKFIKMDACDMSKFQDGQFSAIIDKATLDAVYVDETDTVTEYVGKYWSEIDRVLRVGGRYIAISLLQKHIIEGLLKRFALNNWMFRVVRCIQAEEKMTEESIEKSSLPVFMVIASKFQKLPSLVLEVCMAGDKMIRVNTVDEVVETILSIQKASLVCNGLARSNIAGRRIFDNYFLGFASNKFLFIGMDEVLMDLYDPSNNKTPRYTIHILDQKPNREHDKYAAFIVPQGRLV